MCNLLIRRLWFENCSKKIFVTRFFLTFGDVIYVFFFEFSEFFSKIDAHRSVLIEKTVSMVVGNIFSLRKPSQWSLATFFHWENRHNGHWQHFFIEKTVSMVVGNIFSLKKSSQWSLATFFHWENRLNGRWQHFFIEKTVAMVVGNIFSLKKSSQWSLATFFHWKNRRNLYTKKDSKL
jgi:hypothetical protein